MKLKSSIIIGLTCLAVPLGVLIEPQAAVTDGLVVHLTFDKTYANSITASGVDGAPVGDPTFETGLMGSGAVSLTSDAGIFNYVTLGNADVLNFGSVTDGTAVDFTVSFWCSYTNQASDPVFIATQNWNSSGNQGWGLYMQGGGNTRVVISDGSTKSDQKPAPIIRDGTWHNYLVTFARAGEASVYVDGAFASSLTMANVVGSVDVSNPLNIGQDGTGAYDAKMVNVLMDDLGIWRRALSPGEIAAIYNAGKTGKNLEQVPAIPNPFVQSTTPALNASGVAPNTPISAVITDGLTRLNGNSVQFVVNGTTLPGTVTKVGSTSTVKCQPSALLPSGVTTVSLVFANDATPTAALFTNTWTFTSTYVSLPPAVKVTPDTSKPGFTWTIFANAGNVTDDNSRTENALLGRLTDADGNLLTNLADPSAQGVASATTSAPNPDNATISFAIPTVINVNTVGGAVGGTGTGTFQPDDQMPGVPATDGSTSGLSVEIVTYIDLPAGLTIMGVASDDGFRTTAGWPLDAFSTQIVGEYNGGRGVTESLLMVVAQEAGTYAFRTIYENGGDVGDIEWYTVKADGTKVLVNDVANGGLRASRATTTATPPVVKFVDPLTVPRQLNLVSRTLTAIVADGGVAVNDSSIALSLEGKPVTVTKTRNGKVVTVVYTPTTLAIPGQEMSAQLTFKDSTGASYTRDWKFYNLKNLVLPTPKVTENFDSYADGSVPTGWNAWNFTDCSGDFCTTPGMDINNLNSDSYRGWIAVARATLEPLKSRIFQVAAGETLNGQPVTVDDLSTGSLLYAESDARGGNQAQFIISKPFDLSQITNVVMSFASLYEQNQDSMGSVEYSVDGGKNWLPVVYFIDTKDSGGDIVLNLDGSVDAVKTLTNPNTDTAYWTDNGVAKGGKYGDGIAAPITQALAPYITPRWNDNAVVDKRIEAFRLSEAGKKADVRLRFAQLGTGSWYFGVDNLAFYEDPAPVSQPVSVKLTITASGANVTIAWTGTGTLQEASSIGGTWTASSGQSNPQTIAASGTKFYRVVR